MSMKSVVSGGGFAAVLLAGLVAWGGAEVGEAKYTLKVPDGLAFAEFKGFESWQVVAVSHPSGNTAAGMTGSEVLNIILANPAMIEAYKAGVPANGKPFPDGAKLAKLQYIPKKSTEAPFDVSIPDHLKDVAFMVRDSKRFANTGSWGWALFDYDTAKDAYTPNGTGAACGFVCHASVAKKDYVFTSYGRR